MTRIICASCGANSFVMNGRYRVCQFCNTTYEIKQNSRQNISPQRKSSPSKNYFLPEHAEISIQSDVERLLEKCRSDPSRAERYASLVLDIDPTNQEAQKYVFFKPKG